jgi:hypothetical protein
MAAEIFPKGFKILAAGKARTKPHVWDFERREHLVERMGEFLDDGLTQEDAASKYIELYCPERASPKSLANEYRRALKRPWTDYDHQCMTDRLAEEADEIRRGK